MFECLQQNCNLRILFFLITAHIFFCLCVWTSRRCFDFYLLYIFCHIYKKKCGLNKRFSGFRFSILRIFRVALWSHDCLAFVCPRGCASAAAAVQLGTCASEPACTRAFAVPSSPLPFLSSYSSTSFIHKMQQHLTAIFTLASSC